MEVSLRFANKVLHRDAVTISPDKAQNVFAMVDESEFDEYDDDGFDEAFADLIHGLKEAETRSIFDER